MSLRNTTSRKRSRVASVVPSPEEASWYKDAIIYELHVRAFADSNGDGIGDFAGLTGKLDYLKDLGINTLWLLPFYPSPLKDDGYDIADYMDVNPSYGTLSDFVTFLKEAHRRGLRVITELVLNHTSDQHPWFQRARSAPEGTPWREWYVWSRTTERYREARIIFSDYETSNWSWDPVAKSYYWHRFFSHQPDLNFDHPDVHQAMLQIVDFWLGLGVDGFRLDAVPYLYERDGTSCENIPETHEFLRKLRSHVEAGYPGRVLLAEANQWPEDAIAYFGRGDECHMAFHFPIMARMFLSVHMEDRFPMVDILAQTPPIPESAQWALFLRNHDELTLEMVTDEERDYMYRVYARDQQARFNLGIRRRLAPLLQNNRKKIELLNALLFSLPGTPVIYYGDEIGMGDNIFLGDRNGVRTPMQWSGDRNAGFSRANSQRLYLPPTVDPEYHYEAVNVEAQQANSQSLLWWMKRLLALSRHWKAFGRGSIEVLAPENRKILAFLRKYQEEVILVVANLSRFPQYVELDLSALAERIPVELFGHTDFPRIEKTPYLLTLGPHSFYWFSLEPTHAPGGSPRRKPVRRIDVAGSWTAAFEGKSRGELEKALEDYLRDQPWMHPAVRRLKGVRISEVIPLPKNFQAAAIAILETDYFEGEPECYSLPLVWIASPADGRGNGSLPAIAQMRLRDRSRVGEGILVNGLTDEAFTRRLGGLLTHGTPVPAGAGELFGKWTPKFQDLVGAEKEPLSMSPAKEDSLHSSLLLGTRLTFHWVRKMEAGKNPDLEVAEQLLRQDPPPPILPLAGVLEYRRNKGEALCLAFLRGSVPGSTEAWTLTLEELGRYFERVRSAPELEKSVRPARPRMPWAITTEVPDEFQAFIGPYLAHAQQLGKSAAALHEALLRADGQPGFGPEPIGPSQQRSVYQTLRKKVMRTLPLLSRKLRAGSPTGAADLSRLGILEEQLDRAFHALLRLRPASVRIRCHGDMTLHRFVSTGNEFILKDWSGPEESAVGERRIKRSPLCDVASMVNSFRSAANHALLEQLSSGEVTPERWPLLEAGAAAWYAGVGARYLKAYQESLKDPRFGLGNADELDLLLSTFLLEMILGDLAAFLEGAAASEALVLKTLSDLLDAAQSMIKRNPGASAVDGAWPEARAWMNLVRESTRPASSVKGASLPSRYPPAAPPYP